MENKQKLGLKKIFSIFIIGVIVVLSYYLFTVFSIVEAGKNGIKSDINLDNKDVTGNLFSNSGISIFINILIISLVVVVFFIVVFYIPYKKKFH